MLSNGDLCSTELPDVKKLCYVATIPAAVHAFLRVHIQAAADKYEVTVICNSADKHLLDGLNARVILLPIERRPSPWRDMLVLFQLFKLFRRERFDIVHSIMPKIGMLAMLAARLARLPIRIHTFTGQVWVTKHGAQHMLLKWFDKLIGNLATCILADSPSQRDFLVNEKVLQPGKAKVIGAGSICGVDPLRFHPDFEVRQTVRHDLGITKDARVILFVGRLNQDKGILDLAAAFNVIAKHNPDVVLLLVGAEEDVPFNRIQEICYAERDRLMAVGSYQWQKGFDFVLRAYAASQARHRFSLHLYGQEYSAYSATLHSLARRLGLREDSVVFHEGVSEEALIAAYCQAQLVLSGSHTECQPLVLLDANAAGTPFVARTTGCIATMPGGVAIRTWEEMAHQLDALTDGGPPWHSLSDAGRQAAKDIHHPDHTARRLLDALTAMGVSIPAGVNDD